MSNVKVTTSPAPLSFDEKMTTIATHLVAHSSVQFQAVLDRSQRLRTNSYDSVGSFVSCSSKGGSFEPFNLSLRETRGRTTLNRPSRIATMCGYFGATRLHCRQRVRTIVAEYPPVPIQGRSASYEESRFVRPPLLSHCDASHARKEPLDRTPEFQGNNASCHAAVTTFERPP